MRFMSLPVLAILTVAAVGTTTGLASSRGSGAGMDDVALPGNQRLLGIHHISLKDGVTAEDFERFVAEDWQPVMSERIPGVHIMILKGERNASGGEYLMVWDVQTVGVRDRYFPTPDSASAAFTAINQACGEACTALGEQLNNMTEETSYADYVEIARD